MTKTGIVFKIAAVVNAVVLFGGYVWYRGSSVSAVEPAPTEAAAPDSNAAVAIPATPKGIPVATAREALMFSSKSSGAVFQSDVAVDQKRSEVLPGPKSWGFRFDDEFASPAQPAPSARVAAPPIANASGAVKRSVVMPSSKVLIGVGSVEWIDTAPQPARPAPPRRAVPVDDSKTESHQFSQDSESAASEIKALRKEIERLRQEYARRAVPSQSAAVKAPAPPAPAPTPAPPRRRVIMDGSKSAKADFDIPATEQQQAPTQRK